MLIAMIIISANWRTWIALRKLRSIQATPAGAEPPGLFQNPDGNAGADDARFAAGHAGLGFDVGEGVAQIAHDPLQELRFLGAGQSSQQFFGFLDDVYWMEGWKMEGWKPLESPFQGYIPST